MNVELTPEQVELIRNALSYTLSNLDQYNEARGIEQEELGDTFTKQENEYIDLIGLLTPKGITE